MEDLKGRLFVGLGVVVFVVGLCLGINYLENYEETFYTRIDNTKIQKLEGSKNSDMPFEYTLDCYDKDGKKKEFKFKTVRELREDAFLKLTIRLTGVYGWEEVMYEELPPEVQNVYKN